MKNNMITKALAGSLLVAASMSANATTETTTTTFGVLPALTIAGVDVWVPLTTLTGAAGTTCTWTPTLLAPTATTPDVTSDITIERTGDGCPNLTAGTAGTTALAGSYTVVAAGATNVDVQIELVQGTGGDLTFDPAGVGSPDDGSAVAVAIPTGTPTIVNLGANAQANIYVGGTTTVGGTGISTNTAVAWDLIATY